MIISTVLQIISAALLLTVPEHHWHVAVLTVPWGVSASFYFISYHVALSKIKHRKHVGKELGHLQIYEKIGFFLGPIIGGVIGSELGPQYIFATSVALLVLSLVPLFLTKEPVRTHQKLTFRLLPITKLKRDFVSYAFLSVENTICINAWPFYAAVFVLTGAVYAQLGFLTAFGVVVAMVSAKLVGRWTDSSMARQLLRYAVISNALLYVARPFASSALGVFVINSVNEALTAAYKIPYTKGFYASADNLPGLRIVYISSMESVGSIYKATVWFLLAVLATSIALKPLLIGCFVVAAVASLGIMTERYKALNAAASAS